MKRDTGYLIVILLLLIAAAGAGTWGFQNHRTATSAREELAVLRQWTQSSE